MLVFDFGGQPVSTDGEEEKNIYPDYYIEEGLLFSMLKPPMIRRSAMAGLYQGFTKLLLLQPFAFPEQDLFLAKTAGINQFHPYENQLLNKLIWSRQPASFRLI